MDLFIWDLFILETWRYTPALPCFWSCMNAQQSFTSIRKNLLFI